MQPFGASRWRIPRPRILVLIAVAAVFVAVALAGLRVMLGPTSLPWLKPTVERGLEAQVGGGRARIEAVRLVWFGKARSLGLELDGVRLLDGKGREVIHARRMEAGVSLDALSGFNLTLGRVAAQDFFAAVSVSPRGRYQLGYDAAGAPGKPTRLDGLLADLTGAPRFGRPISFFRQLDLSNGRLALRQVGGAAAWTADIRRARFDKLDGRLNADVDLSLNDGRSAAPAVLFLKGRSAVGLSDTVLQARLDGLTPARVFPSVGATRPLSTLDAVVMGRGSLSYDLKAGLRAADVRLEAGQGALRLGDRVEAFQSAEMLAAYDPARRQVMITALKLFAEKTRLDMRGRIGLVPEDTRRRRPARFDFTLQGPQLFASLSADAPSQALTDVSVTGSFTPAERRLAITDGHGLLAGAPAVATARFTQDSRRRWAAKLDARIGGTITPDQVFAFWPSRLAHDTRDWLRRTVQSGRFTNATFTIDAPGGAFTRGVVRDSELRIGFDFTDAGMRFADEFPAISEGVGKAAILGNSFDLGLVSGRMGEVALSEGSIVIPRFKPIGETATFRVRAIGEAPALLGVIDGPKLQLLTKHGFSPSRVSGTGDVRIEITRPMRHDVTYEDYRISYEGVLKQAGLKQAALGWDMTGGDLTVDGDEDKVAVKGVGTVGPYRGKVEFGTRYGAEGDHGQTIDIDGVVQASILGGKAGLTAPLSGKFRVIEGAGAGAVHSPMFEGRLNWKPGDGRDRLVLEGWGGAAILRKIGVPFLASVPDRFPAEVRLARSGDTFRGPIRADALSGQLTFTTGLRPHVLYEAEVSPIEARRMGLGRLPMFDQTRPVSVDASWAGEQGAAQIRAGDLNLAVSWAHAEGLPTEHRLKANLSNADLSSLGLPALARPGVAVPVSAVWRPVGDGMMGSADIDGLPIRFTTVAIKGGGVASAVKADLDAATVRRLGVPDLIDIDGSTALNMRWASSESRQTSGHFDLDLTRAGLSVAHSDWKKPAGQAARLGADFIQGDDGSLKLSRISGDGAGIDIDGSAVIGGGRLISLDLGRAKLTGLLDAAVRIWRDPQAPGLNVNLRGRWLDARRLFDKLSDKPGPGGSGGDGAPLRIDASFDGLRLTNTAVLRDVHAVGVMGAPAIRRLDLTAATTNGSRLKGRLYPLSGGTALTAETGDAGDLAQTLFGVKSLRGGSGVLTGRLVAGGADLNLEMKNVRLIRAPTMAQILTMASLRGLADTLNGEGVMFTKVVAPVQIRGDRIVVGEARATGSALGLTTKGVVDLGDATLDFQGTIVPAYGINSAVGAVPVLGELLTSRKGEGVVGLGYSARGSFAKPEVFVNPLSLMTPGILRRMFEGPTPSTETPVKPKRTVPTKRAGAEP